MPQINRRTTFLAGCVYATFLNTANRKLDIVKFFHGQYYIKFPAANTKKLVYNCYEDFNCDFRVNPRRRRRGP